MASAPKGISFLGITVFVFLSISTNATADGVVHFGNGHYRVSAESFANERIQGNPASQVTSSRARNELNKKRPLGELDRCWWGQRSSPKSFSETLQSMVEWYSKNEIEPFRGIYDGFQRNFGLETFFKKVKHGVPIKNKKMHLNEQNLCENMQRKDLEHLLGERASKRVSDQALAAVNHFSSLVNRSQGAERMGHWSRFMGCLAQTETLTSAPTHPGKSYGINRPAGVKITRDLHGDRRLVAGLFQFSMKSHQSNANECIKRWNATKPECPIRHKSADLSKHLIESGQVLNAFCGMHKIMESFYVQTHTSSAGKTAPQNRITRGTSRIRRGKFVKARANLAHSDTRCVTPFSSFSYNHFGPLEASYRDNFNKMASCLVGGKEMELKQPKMTYSQLRSKFLEVATQGFGCQNYASEMKSILANNPSYVARLANSENFKNQMLEASKTRCNGYSPCLDLLPKSTENLLNAIKSKDKSKAELHRLFETIGKMGTDKSYRCRM